MSLDFNNDATVENVIIVDEALMEQLNLEENPTATDVMSRDIMSNAIAFRNSLVRLTTSQTVSNKTLDSSCDINACLPSSVALKSATQTLSNKTLDSSCDISACLPANTVTTAGTQTLKIPNGTVSTPGIQFTNESNSGFYRDSSTTNQFLVAVNGTNVAGFNQNGIIASQINATANTFAFIGGRGNATSLGTFNFRMSYRQTSASGDAVNLTFNGPSQWFMRATFNSNLSVGFGGSTSFQCSTTPAVAFGTNGSFFRELRMASVTLSSVNLDGQTNAITQAVTFSPALATTPFVIGHLTANSGSTNAAAGVISFSNVSTTGATINLWNGAAPGTAITGNLTVNVTAYCL